MFLIVGLGNPGIKYKKTRHNIGFLVIKEMLTVYGLKLKTVKNSNAKSIKTNIESNDIILATPTTFMNNSGFAVQSLAQYYHPKGDQPLAGKIKPENIIIIHDDIDLSLGKIRIKDKGSSGGHNGIKSIIENLGTKNFTRLKIGIGPQPDNVSSEKYVLQKFSKKEQKILKSKVIPHTTEAIQEILKNGVKSAMNRYN